MYFHIPASSHFIASHSLDLKGVKSKPVSLGSNFLNETTFLPLKLEMHHEFWDAKGHWLKIKEGQADVVRTVSKCVSKLADVTARYFLTVRDHCYPLAGLLGILPCHCKVTVRYVNDLWSTCSSVKTCTWRGNYFTAREAISRWCGSHQALQLMHQTGKLAVAGASHCVGKPRWCGTLALGFSLSLLNGHCMLVGGGLTELPSLTGLCLGHSSSLREVCQGVICLESMCIGQMVCFQEQWLWWVLELQGRIVVSMQRLLTEQMGGGCCLCRSPCPSPESALPKWLQDSDITEESDGVSEWSSAWLEWTVPNKNAVYIQDKSQNNCS